MQLNNIEKSSNNYSNLALAGVRDEDARKMDLLLEVIEAESTIADTVNMQYGSNASNGMYTIEHISLSGSSVRSISLDINKFVSA